MNIIDGGWPRTVYILNVTVDSKEIYEKYGFEEQPNTKMIKVFVSESDCIMERDEGLRMSGYSKIVADRGEASLAATRETPVKCGECGNMVPPGDINGDTCDNCLASTGW